MKLIKKGGIGTAPILNKNDPSKRKAITALVVLTLGVAMLPASALANNYIATEIDEGIEEQITVPDRQDDDYTDWKSNDHSDAVPIYRIINMWNLTNPKKTLKNGIPIFEEIGPYTFREYTYKYNVQFDNRRDEVTYNEYTRYEFLPEDSRGLSLKDNITNFNPAYLGVLEETNSEAGLIQAMFPMVLQEVRSSFIEELDLSMAELLTEEGIYNMLVGAIEDVIAGLTDELNVETINTIATTMVDFLTIIIPLDVLVLTMIYSMPNCQEIFYEEWANDFFPVVDLNTTFLINHFLNIIEDIIDILLDIILWWDLFGWIKNTARNFLVGLFADLLAEDSPLIILVKDLFGGMIQDLGAQMINTEGSETGEGVDIDGRDPYNYPGSYADLNISTHSLGGSGINQTQSIALWDENNPFSLTGFDGLENPIWFEAIYGVPDSINLLMDEFDLNEFQLQYILDWIVISIIDWLKNLCEWQILEWNSGLLTTRTVEEWLFYANDTLIYNQDPERANVGFFLNCQNKNEAKEAKTDKYTIKTGKGDINEVYQTVKFNDNDEITIWANDPKVTGTDGTQFAPKLDTYNNLEVFTPDLMRVVEFEFKEFTSIYDIELYRYYLKDKTFEIDPNFYMLIDGCANMLPYHKTPIHLSKPHFADGDKILINSVSGLDPNPDDYDTIIEVEPLTGITMNSVQRMQINIETHKTDCWYQNVTEAIMPILWLEIEGKITEEKAQLFKDLVYGALNTQRTARIMILAIGAALISPSAKVTSTQAIMRQKVKSKKKLSAIKKKKSLLNTKTSNLKNVDPLKTNTNSDHKNSKISILKNKVKKI